MIGGTKDSDPGYRAVRCPFRRLIVLLPQGGEELVAATTFIRSGPRLSSQVISGGRDKAPRHHLKRETLSRRRPADGADILGGVVGPADPLPGGIHSDRIPPSRQSSSRDQRLIYPIPPPVRRPFRQRPHLLNCFFPIGSQLHEP